MNKLKALELLGGSVASAADAIGITYQAVDKWPDELPDRIADRVLAAVARKHLPPELLGEAGAQQAPAAAPSPAPSESHTDRRQPVDLPVTVSMSGDVVAAPPPGGVHGEL